MGKFVRIILGWTMATVLALNVGAEDKKDDKEKLQGEWSVVSMNADRKKPDEDEFKKWKLTVKGDEWLVTIDAKATTTKIAVIDSSKSPKEIDLKMKLKAPKGDATFKGIYKLEEDTLTVCQGRRPTRERPKEFKADDDVILTVYKRVVKK